MENHKAKHFVLQFGSLISLYLSVSFLITLLFGLINITHPDPTEGSWGIESAASAIRIGIAMVVVFFPTYLVLTRLVNKQRRTSSDSLYVGFTKWLIYLSLLVAGLALLVDLVVVIMTFLEGDMTQRFILKALTVLAIVGAAFHYYLLDAKGYWLKQEGKSIYYGIGMGLIAVVSVIYGFSNIDNPNAARDQKIDDQQISDLQNIQYQIEGYYSLNNTLPDNLTDLPLASDLPKAAAERSPYEYRKLDYGFALCANFSKASKNDQYFYQQPFDDKAMIKNGDNWTHPAGYYCFERAISGELVPTLKQ